MIIHCISTDSCTDDNRRRWWTHPGWLLALILPLLAGRVLAEPGAFIGHSLGEQYDGLWIQWLFNRALEQGRLPLQHPGVLANVDLWFYPVDPSTLAVRGLLSRVMGAVAAFNVTAVALVGLLAGSTVLLAREVGANRWGAALAGLVAMLHPGFLGYLADGRAESCVTGWSVLVCWAALRLVRRPGTRPALLLAALTGALALAGPNHFVATVAALVVPAAVVLVRGDWKLRRSAALAVAGGTLLCLPVLAGLWKAELQQDSRGGWKTGEPPALVELLPAVEARKRLALWQLADELTRAPQTHHWTRMTRQQAQINQQSRNDRATLPPNSLAAPGARRFVWLSALLLGLVGLVRRPRQVWPWLTGAALLGLLSHGNGCGNAPPIALPWSDQYLMLRPAVLLHWMPYFLNYGIFASLAAVALGVAASLGLASLPWRPALCGVLALGLCFAEAQWAGPTPLPLPATQAAAPDNIVQALRATPGVAVATFPCDTRQLLLQTWHEQEVLFQWNNMDAWMKSGLHELQRKVNAGDVHRHFVDQLRRRGVGAVVVFPKLLPQGMAHILQTALGRHARRTVKDGDWAALFLF